MRQLTRAGCKKVFREIVSGAKTEHSQLRRALDQLAPGDVLMVTRLGRPGPLGARPLYAGSHYAQERRKRRDRGGEPLREIACMLTSRTARFRGW